MQGGRLRTTQVFFSKSTQSKWEKEKRKRKRTARGGEVRFVVGHFAVARAAVR